jgi:hypothetical protein
MSAGWSLTEPIVAGDLTLLPRNGRWESLRYGAQRSSIVNVTNGGVRTGYVLHERETASVRGYGEWIFEIFAEQVAAYKAIDSAAHGDVLPFWFVPDHTNMSDRINCRLVDKQFSDALTALEPGAFNGSMQQRFRYVMRISAEVEDQTLED